MIRDAKARGLDVTTEAYPYTAGSSGIESALFDPGWQQALGIDYHDVEWAATGERLTAATFEQYRKQHGIVIVHMIPDDVVAAAIASPLTFIASDARLQNGHGHPRSAGAFARVLGYYVRDTHTLSLVDALTKMTLMPARRLEHRVPAMRHKGRVQIGADADLVVFDPTRVADRATYERPAQYSEGFEYVFVGGVPVVWRGQLREETLPGQALRAAPSRPVKTAALRDANRRRPPSADRLNRDGLQRQVGIRRGDTARGPASQAEQAANALAHPERGHAVPNGLLGVADPRRDFLERDRTAAPYLAQDREHVDVLRRTMAAKSCFHDALSYRRAAAAEHERNLFDRRTTQVERHHPRFSLLAVQSRCARNVGAGGSVSARGDSPCGEGAHPRIPG